jgi:BirA family biotin operon repressor/biotin-[acetyl-CoA-carboxylase] ligase
MDTSSLLRVLADGELHSGEDLARRFGVTRAAVAKHRGKLQAWGLAVTAVPGAGYRLEQPIDLLTAAAVRAELPRDVEPLVANLDVHLELDSTNRVLLDRAPPHGSGLDVCIAEYQHAGRGRRGRTWRAPLGACLCLSAAWRFAETPPELAALALAVGVAVRRAVARTARIEIALKWPNDLVYAQRKLGGILLELAAEAHGGCRVVAGVGLNVSVPRAQLAELCDWPGGAIDVATAGGAPPPPRAELAAAIVAELALLLVSYAETGFEPYRREWRAADCLRGRAIDVLDARGSVSGTALGIDGDGALLVATADGERRRVLSGDVSVRAAS